MPTGFVKVGFGMGVPDTARILNPIAAGTLYDQDGNEIGYVTEVSPSTTRTVERQRHFDAADAGKVVELTYRPEDYSLNVTGFLLYHPGYEGLATGSLIDRLYRGGATTAEAVFMILNKQYIPFDLIWEEIHPATQKGTRTHYINCLVQSWNGARTLTSSFVAERVTLIVSAIEIEVVS